MGTQPLAPERATKPASTRSPFDLNILVIPVHTLAVGVSRQSVGDGDSTCSGTSCGNECSSVSGQPGCDN
jgi:hypothetical protein